MSPAALRWSSTSIGYEWEQQALVSIDGLLKLSVEQLVFRVWWQESQDRCCGATVLHLLVDRACLNFVRTGSIVELVWCARFVALRLGECGMEQRARARMYEHCTVEWSLLLRHEREASCGDKYKRDHVCG